MKSNHAYRFHDAGFPDMGCIISATSRVGEHNSPALAWEAVHGRRVSTVSNTAEGRSACARAMQCLNINHVIGGFLLPSAKYSIFVGGLSTVMPSDLQV